MSKPSKSQTKRLVIQRQPKVPPPVSKKPKILLWDIESSYLMARIWAPGHKISVSHKQLVPGFDRTKIICIGWKWADQLGVNCLDWGVRRQDEKPMLKAFSDLVAQADLLVGHNSDSFDAKHLNTALLVNGLPPLPSVTSSDTLKQARKYFRFPSNSLDYLSHLLTEAPKTKCDWVDWVAVVEGKDPAALARMKAYCQQDVLALEAVWEKFATYCETKIHHNVATLGVREGCQKCGSFHVNLDGAVIRRTGRHQRFQCKSCGYKWADTRKIKEDQ